MVDEKEKIQKSLSEYQEKLVYEKDKSTELTKRTKSIENDLNLKIKILRNKLESTNIDIIYEAEKENFLRNQKLRDEFSSR